jgi:hypothetical protein
MISVDGASDVSPTGDPPLALINNATIQGGLDFATMPSPRRPTMQDRTTEVARDQSDMERPTY